MARWRLGRSEDGEEASLDSASSLSVSPSLPLSFSPSFPPLVFLPSLLPCYFHPPLNSSSYPSIIHVYFFFFFCFLICVSFRDLYLRLVSFLTTHVIPLPSFFLFCPPLSLFNFPDLSFLFHTFPFPFLSVLCLFFLFFYSTPACLSLSFLTSPLFSFFSSSITFLTSSPFLYLSPSFPFLTFPLSSSPFHNFAPPPSVPQANGSQLFVLKSETTRPTCVCVCVCVSQPGFRTCK